MSNDYNDNYISVHIMCNNYNYHPIMSNDYNDNYISVHIMCDNYNYHPNYEQWL